MKNIFIESLFQKLFITKTEHQTCILGLINMKKDGINIFGRHTIGKQSTVGVSDEPVRLKCDINALSSRRRQ